MNLEKNMNWPKMTICETHRQIYRAIINDEPRDRVLALLKQAFKKFKRVDREFRKINRWYDKGWYEDNPEYDPSK